MKAHKISGTTLKHDVLKQGKAKISTIIGIDPGLQKMGIGILQLKDSKPVKPEIVQVTKKRTKHHFCPKNIAKSIAGYSTITLKLKQNHTLDARLHYIFEELSKLFEEHNPCLVMVEDAFVGINKNSALKLGLARGSILTAIGKHRLKYEAIPPKQIKMEVAGNGAAQKEEIDELFNQLLPKWEHNTSLDAADALAAAFCGVKVIVEENS